MRLNSAICASLSGFIGGADSSLGGASSALVTVRWPGGAVEEFEELPANSRVLLVEGAGVAESFPASPRPLVDPLPKGLRVDLGDKVAADKEKLDTDLVWFPDKLGRLTVPSALNICKGLVC